VAKIKKDTVMDNLAASKRATDNKVFTRAYFEVVQTHMVCQFMLSRSGVSVASDVEELQRCFFCEPEDW